MSTILIILLLSWLLPLLAILIYLDSCGPILFTQVRCKRNLKAFSCFKLRTMIVNNEAHSRSALPDDERITRVGAILRKFHLDELPQLFNVWWGDMSLIGPRPYMLYENDRYLNHSELFELRYQIKPGMTGLAQCHGFTGFFRKENDFEGRLRFDLDYLYQWSLGLDIKILIKTIKRLYC
ncbi:MAG TPA: sugar transferase [Flavisolibacter sp.]|nr:sugar transferase [Flavisolibacter sp.]